MKEDFYKKIKNKKPSLHFAKFGRQQIQILIKSMADIDSNSPIIKPTLTKNMKSNS